MPFTDEEKTDIRRFCGYPAYGAGASGFQSWRFFQAYGTLEYRLNNMSTAELVVVRRQLTALSLLEQGLVEAAAAIDTHAAATWQRNPNEPWDRQRLFDDMRRRLCGFLRYPAWSGLGRLWDRFGRLMDGPTLQDRISRGLGIAARRIGEQTDAYRPRGATQPLAKTNRYLRLSAAFSALDGGFGRSNAYGDPLWHGMFDAAYTKPGDYLVQARGTWFIAAQQPLLPVLCVRADRVVSFSRPATPSRAGVNAYGGVTRQAAKPLMTDWPASLLTSSSGSRSGADLPADSSTATWTILLPAVPNVVLRSSDLMVDDLGRSGIVAAAELTELGWRLQVNQATT